MNTVTVRQAGLADVDTLAPLFDRYRQFYGNPSDLAGAQAFLQARLGNAESVAFIAYVGDTAAGFTQLYPSFSSGAMGRIYVLNDLFVEEQCRKQGVGNQLITAATGFGRAQGAVRLTLSTAVTNSTARSVYAGAGWTRDDRFYVYNLAL